MISKARHRVHWLDALAPAIVVIGIASGVVGYRALRGAQPKVDALVPAIIRPNATARVRLLGRDLRPFVQLFVVKAGAPFVLHDPSSGYQQATFFLLNPREAEIEAPALASGLYDLYLYDQGQRVALLSAALRVQPDRRQPATIAAIVRFFVPIEMAPLIRIGDRDRQQNRQAAVGDCAEVRDIATSPRLVETVDLHEMDSRVFGGPQTASRVIDVKLSVPVTRDDAGVWTYKGAPVRAGEDFTLETGRYVVSGVTLDVDTGR